MICFHKITYFTLFWVILFRIIGIDQWISNRLISQILRENAIPLGFASLRYLLSESILFHSEAFVVFIPVSRKWLCQEKCRTRGLFLKEKHFYNFHGKYLFCIYKMVHSGQYPFLVGWKVSKTTDNLVASPHSIILI